MKYVFTVLLIVGGDSFCHGTGWPAARLVPGAEYLDVRLPKEQAGFGPATEGRERMLWLCQAELRG